MILRSINQRMFLVGLAPLALLAVALVAWNGFSRISEAEQELLDAQTLTQKLLNAPAVDALVVGNKLAFEQLITDVIHSSSTHTCIALTDTTNRVLIKAGACNTLVAPTDVFPITAASAGLSDFTDGARGEERVGYLRVSMSDHQLIAKKHQVILQLALSVALIALVVLVVAKLMRARLVIPIQKMDAAMQALSRRDYGVQLQIDNEDEVGRLGRAINATIKTTAGYTQELLRRRDDADRSLHEADEANLSRYSLVRSLTEELEGPLTQLQADLTALAMANADTSQKQRIKSIIATLQETQSNFDDLIEVATSSPKVSQPPFRPLADFQSELAHSIGILADTVGLPTHFEFSPTLSDEIRGASVDVDVQRTKKAVEYVIRAMCRHCTTLGIYVHADVIKMPSNRIQLSIQLKGFYDTSIPSTSHSYKPALPGSKAPPLLLRWTDRDVKIVEYLLNEVHMSATYSNSPSGTVIIHLEALARFANQHADVSATADWAFGARPVHTLIVSDDFSLQRLTTRGALSPHEIKLIPFAVALANVASLRDTDVLMIDIDDDVAGAFSLLQEFNTLPTGEARIPRLVALCAAGILSDALQMRLFGCGFQAVLQRPLQYARLIEVVQRIVLQPIAKLSINS